MAWLAIHYIHEQRGSIEVMLRATTNMGDTYVKTIYILAVVKLRRDPGVQEVQLVDDPTQVRQEK